MIFGIKRKGTFIPSPGTKTTPGIRGPMGRADRPRPRLHPLRTDPAALPRPPSSTGKTAAEPTCQTWPSSVRDVITTCTTAGTPSPWTPTPSRHHPHQRTPETTGPPGSGYKRSESVSGLRGRWDVLDLHQFRRPRLPRRKWGRRSPSTPIMSTTSRSVARRPPGSNPHCPD